MKGTIRKRGMTWSYIVDLPSADGKRKQKQKGGFRTKKECETALQTIIYQITNGLIETDDTIIKGNINIDNNNQTQQVYKTNKPLIMLSDVIDEYLEYSKKRVKYTTLQNYKRLLQIMKTINKPVNEVTSNDVINAIKTNTATKLTDSSVKAYLLRAKVFFNYIVKMGYVDKSPLKDVNITPNYNQINIAQSLSIKKSILEKEEIKKFYKYFDDNKDNNYIRQFGVIFKLLLETGMRIGECLALEWQDINIEEQSITIYKTINNITAKHKTYNLTSPKTKSSNRVIFFNENIQQELIIQKEFIDGLKKQKDYWKKNNFVFTCISRQHTQFGFPVNDCSVRQFLRYLCKKLNIKYISPHKLRHTNTSMLCELGVPLDVISKQLGHSNTTITSVVYLHASNNVKQKIANGFNILYD